MKLGTHKLSLQDTLLASIGLASLLGQLARLETPLGTLSFYEILMVLFILFTIWKKKARTVFSYSILWLGGAFLVWSVGITLSIAWPNFSPAFSGIAYLVRFALYAVFAWSLVLWKTHTNKPEDKLWWGTTLWLFLMALLGIGQYLLFPDTRILVELGWDDHLSRAFGTLFDPTFYGAITALGSIWFFYQGSVRSKKIPPLIWQIGYAISLLATTLSFSRAAYIAYVAGFLGLAGILRQRRILLAIPLLIMALFLVPKDGGGEGQKLLRTRSIEQRIDHAEYQTQNWSNREVVLGRGWIFSDAQERRTAGLAQEYQLQEIPETVQYNHAQLVDSTYLQIVLTSGLIGLLLFLLFLSNWWHILPPVGKATLASIAVYSLISPGFFYPWILLALIGIGVSGEQKKDSSNFQA